MKAKTSDVWVQEMFEAIFKRSNVKSSMQSLSWMPEVSPLIGGDGEAKERSANVLVGERFFFFSRRFATRFRGFQREKSLCVQTNVLQKLFWVNRVKEEDHEDKI